MSKQGIIVGIVAIYFPSTGARLKPCECPNERSAKKQYKQRWPERPQCQLRNCGPTCNRCVPDFGFPAARHGQFRKAGKKHPGTITEHVGKGVFEGIALHSAFRASGTPANHSSSFLLRASILLSKSTSMRSTPHATG